MTIEERCRHAEMRLEEIQAALIEPNAEKMAHCESELSAVIDALVDPPIAPSLDPRNRAAIQRLQKTVRRVSLQLAQGANLCQGWMQLRISTGYTEQGRPVLASAESSASYEA